MGRGEQTLRWTRRPRLDCEAREGVAGSTKGCGSGRGASSLGDGGVCEEVFTIRLQREELLIALMKSAGEDAGRKVREESERKQKTARKQTDTTRTEKKKTSKKEKKGELQKRGNVQENRKLLHGKKRMEKKKREREHKGGGSKRGVGMLSHYWRMACHSPGRRASGPQMPEEENLVSQRRHPCLQRLVQGQGRVSRRSHPGRTRLQGCAEAQS